MKRGILLLCLLVRLVASVPALASTGESEAIVAPQCASPAHLGLAPDPAAGWIVIFDDETDPQAKTARLEARHQFKADAIYAFGGFYVEKLSQAELAVLRCEPTVKVIEQNGRASVR
ncbi:MAG: hypothetical protein QOJ98_611 [Acidobacteriota bacterium]|jgi:hypothetical protein|nr:hypothetical protein [Acidobacteriota bacterium]